MSTLRECCEEGDCTIPVSSLPEKVTEMKLRKLKPGRCEEIKNVITDHKLHYIKQETFDGTDWQCGFIFNFRRAIGSGSKKKRNFISFVLISEAMRVYGHSHCTVRLQRKWDQKFNSNKISMIKYFLEQGIAEVSERNFDDDNIGDQEGKKIYLAFNLNILLLGSYLHVHGTTFFTCSEEKKWREVRGNVHRPV